jgi:riboflavin-specific deaminase-like protein
MTRVKFCGLMSQTDVGMAVEAGADALGFVTEYPVPVPWNLDRERSRELAASAPPFVTTVAVVGGSVETILEIARTVRPNFVQLHGDETLEDIRRICTALKENGTKVLKALRIEVDTGHALFDVSDPLEACRALSRSGISGLAVDSKTSSRPAGTGVPLDWTLVREIVTAIDIPVILAGGLTVDNAAEAIRQVRPYGVDVISGVEKEAGVKDPQRREDRLFRKRCVFQRRQSKIRNQKPKIDKRPYTLMLVAVSLDGKISPRRRPGQPNPVGPSLIDPEIMELHNKQRADVDGIMVGLNCILLDDSRLTLRGKHGKNPARIVLDGLAEMPAKARVLGREAPTIVAVTRDAPKRRVRAFEQRGARIVTAGRGRFVDLPELLHRLREEHGIERLLVEGGGTVHRSMITRNLYDEIRLIVCPFVIGGSSSVTPVQRAAFWPESAVPRYRLDKCRVIGDYLYVIYKPAEPADTKAKHDS